MPVHATYVPRKFSKPGRVARRFCCAKSSSIAGLRRRQREYNPIEFLRLDPGWPWPPTVTIPEQTDEVGLNAGLRQRSISRRQIDMVCWSSARLNRAEPGADIKK